MARTVRALRDTGELDNTLIVFTSDNGFLFGEHRLTTKNYAYEEALRVPLLARGPGIPAGVRRSETVSMLDIVPSILAATGAQADVRIDGRNLLPLARRGRGDGWNTLLLQSGPRDEVETEIGRAYRGYTYVRWTATGETELYDRKVDTYQLRNVVEDRDYAPVKRELRRLDALKDCSGADCRTNFGRMPSPR